MSVRAYMLLDITDGNGELALQTLRGRVEIALVDRLEGRPDIIAMFEASDRQRLAEVVMPVIVCIEGFIEDICLMTTWDDVAPVNLSVTAGTKLVGKRVRRRRSQN